MSFEIDSVVEAIARLREKRPVVHAITNWVTAVDVANALNAIGARPVMAVALEEVGEIAAKADALVLNLGTPDPLRVKAMLLAGHSANSLSRPVVFDPVGAGASGFRAEAIRSVLSELRITIIRGNGAEIGALTQTGGKLRGIDSDLGPSDVFASASLLSSETGAVVLSSGPRDLIVQKREAAAVENGHPMMNRVTGTGCMLSAIAGAFAAVEKDPWIAAISGATFFGLAGEWAARKSTGPGTFKAALLDALFTLTPDDLRSGARIR